MFLPNTHSFLLARRQSIGPDSSSATETTTAVISQEETADAHSESAADKPFFGNTRVSSSPYQDFWYGGLSNAHSFSLIRRQSIGSDRSSVTETTAVVISQGETMVVPSESSGEVVVGDSDRRTFLKAAGIAGAGLIASQLLPKQSHALIMGSSPTTGVVGVKNAANTRINPATEETLSTLLKPSDLTFDAGSLQVKVTSLPGAGSSSFSDSGDVAKSALVDAQRHVQVDVLSSALPSSASTETTLQTISFGGFKFTLRLATVGSVDYVGEASIGTTTSAASWRIKKVDSTTGIIIQWAGTGVFDQVWDNRASLSYS